MVMQIDNHRMTMGLFKKRDFNLKILSEGSLLCNTDEIKSILASVHMNMNAHFNFSQMPLLHGTIYFMEWSFGAELWSRVLESNFGAAKFLLHLQIQFI